MINSIRECDMKEIKLSIDRLLAAIWSHNGEVFLLTGLVGQECLLYFMNL